ncbi:4-hydroxybenzoate polyprenyltransferase [Bifidobacterium goeldii]|uniref:4-hydroxybenzoate polyprenyltransferase n=1 Tax=Bifidobacterium goeldii TaxID=2306975 RepID=A0A430FMQ0_9BIFI|nr:4-hydroxybenzoate polyprenyltransferase [Bifidobacterium goeldii]RSX54011.1 4-hydroxybenzoate polyprenyltransferase [Bifidobacterium goeldii]
MASWMEVTRESEHGLPTMLVQAVGIATAMCVCELVSAPLMVDAASGAFNVLPWFLVACLFAVAFTYTVGFALLWAVDSFTHRLEGKSRAWMPMAYALAGGAGFCVWGYAVYPAVINAILVPVGHDALSQNVALSIGANCAIAGMVSFFLGSSVASRFAERKAIVAVAGGIGIVLAILGGIVLWLTLTHVA